jgi:hypothetical protein
VLAVRRHQRTPLPAGGTVPGIDWTGPAVTDWVHRRHRALKLPDGTWRSCTFLDEAMLDCDMHDPARYAARRLGKAGALAPTSGLADSAAGQGGPPRRTDRGVMDGWTVQAVTDVRVIDMSGLSDHHLLFVDCSCRTLVQALRRDIPPLIPWKLRTTTA